MSTETMQPGERRRHEHPEAGAFYVSRFCGPHPDGLPYFCDGRFYVSELAAVDGFFAACAAGVPTDAELVLMDREGEASRVHRIADRIDGYDCDDLGESPDY